MLEAITACKLSKEKEIEQTEVYEEECWDDNKIRDWDYCGWI